MGKPDNRCPECGSIVGYCRHTAGGSGCIVPFALIMGGLIGGTIYVGHLILYFV